MRKLNKIIIKRTIVFIRWFFSSRGLIVLLLSGILVSLAANHIEDMVKRQRYLELLQWEIRSHLDYAAIVSSQNGTSGLLKNLISTRFYQSVVNSGYLTAIDPDVLIRITTYYDVVDMSYNPSLDRDYLILDKLESDWIECKSSIINSSDVAICDKKKKTFELAVKQISPQIQSVWKNVEDEIIHLQIDQKFHPTQDRMNSTFLKFLIGNRI